MEHVTLDCAALTGKRELHETLKTLLSLPDYYGKNLDALFDCLTEPGRDITLTLVHAGALTEVLGAYGRAFLHTLRDAAEENPSFLYDFAEGESAPERPCEI